MLQSHKELAHIFLIIIVPLITYLRLFGKDYFWVIDDLEGIARFSEVYNPQTEEKIDSYDCCEGDKKHKVKHLAFNPHLGFPGCVLRYLRLQIGKRFCVIGTNKKGHDVWGFRQSPRRHHAISIVTHVTNLILGYFFLKPLVGENTALVTCLLYSVHPLTTQTVGWISGINYAWSMGASLAVLNVAYYCHNPLLILVLVPVLAFISSITLYLGCFTWILLLFLGHPWLALIYLLVGMSIFIWKGAETKNYRVKHFKEQNMGATTSFNWKKPIVMAKTLFYYLPSVFLPLKMGLYHVWGYFYEEPIERPNGMFWGGVATAILIIVSFFSGPFAIQLGILWSLSYFILFTNFITAQQFVADRYVTVPAFGVCLILAHLLGVSPFSWFLLGLYAMRTYAHLPTFKNEIDFYMSNFLNFRDSEVALGNLGVAYLNQGMPGSAVDTWLISTKINPHYDVAWYNLYSIFKGNGRLIEARDYLKNCLNAKVVHFKERWEKELAEINEKIEKPKEADSIFNKAREHFEKQEFDKEKDCLLKLVTLTDGTIRPEIMEGLKKRLGEIK